MILLNRVRDAKILSLPTHKMVTSRSSFARVFRITEGLEQPAATAPASPEKKASRSKSWEEDPFWRAFAVAAAKP
jgi:hypothetical protein